MANKVFTKTFGGYVDPLPASNTNVWQFNLSNNNRAFQLKSFSFDLVIRYGAGLSPNIPLSQVRNTYYYLELGKSDFPIASYFDRTAIPPNGVQEDGTIITLYHPKQLVFDSFFVPNVVPIVFDIENYDLFASIYYQCCVVCEISDISVI
jgi:hypothetical protein